MTTTFPPPSGAEKARLMRRVQAVARLRHPNLVRMLPLPGGAGMAPVLGSARRLADFTLPAGTFKRFDLEQVVRLLLDVLSGLAALHEVVIDGHTFVHGEVSPQNIYVDGHGTARLVPLLNSHLTSGTRIEDAGYAAPERLAGGMTDPRGDVFSVGVMLWEALAGKRLYSAAAGPRLLSHKHPPIQLSPRVRWAQPLCAIAERAIAHDPALRFPSALALSNAMAAAAAQQLSRVDTDAWQEEAPTPVFQPNLHLATLRTSATPPPSVLTIAAAAAVAEAAPADDASAPSTDGSAGSRRGLALGLVALAAIAGYVLVRQPPSVVRHFAAAPLPPAALTPPPAAAPVTPPVAPSPAATPVVTAASTEPPPSAVSEAAVPKTSAAVAAAAPARPPPSRPNKPHFVTKAPAAAVKARPNPKLGGRGEDYGI